MDATTAAPPPAAVPIAIYAAVALFVIGRFLMRELKERKLSLARIFVAPGILALLALFLLWFSLTHFATTVTLVAGETLITLGVGSAVGLGVGHFTTVRLGEKPGFVYVLGSWQTVAIWIGALVLRFVARFAFGHDDLATQFGANAALVVMIAAALAFVRYRILIDAKALLAAGTTAAVRVV